MSARLKPAGPGVLATGVVQGNGGRSVVLEACHLTMHFPVRRAFYEPQAVVHAVDDVSLEVRQGETLGLVGESGSGKTTVGRCLLRLIEPTSGEISLEGKDIMQLDGRRLRALRRKMQMVFQDPADSLNPRFTCRQMLTGALRLSGMGDRRRRAERAVGLLAQVGLEASDLDKFPHQFSGGQQQRIAIARALAFDPLLLVLDEPTASLDVSVQTQITNLLRGLQERLSHSYILISHDLSNVRHVAHRVAVMYLGKVMETGQSQTLFENPQHPYTQTLIQSVPIPDPTRRRTSAILEGEIPSAITPPAGCRFHTRCPLRQEICSQVEPALERTPAGTFVACHLVEKAM